MAINIQEILHPSDSSSIKFEKINYNFDQILAHGGGPQGPRGFKGTQGLPGETGQKGEKGDLGPEGLKGEEGTSDSPWYSINVDLDADSSTTTDTYAILKPKVNGFGYNPIVWLGDDLFIEDLQNGDISTNAKLTIAKSGIFDNYLKLVHTGTNTSKLVITSSDDGIYSEFAIQNDFGSPDVSVKLNVDKISLEASTSSINMRGIDINLTSLVNSNIKFNTLGSGIFDVDINTEFKGYLNLPTGVTANRPANPSIGMIFFNSELDITEVYYANEGVGEWRELCTTCGEVQPATIGISGGDINANADGTPVQQSLSLIGGNYDANPDGSEVEDSITTTYTFEGDYSDGEGFSYTGFSMVITGDNYNNADNDPADEFIDAGDSGGGGGGPTPTPTPTPTTSYFLEDPADEIKDLGGGLSFAPLSGWSIKTINGIDVSDDDNISLNVDNQPGSTQNFVIVVEKLSTLEWSATVAQEILVNSTSRLKLTGTPSINGDLLTFTLMDDNTPSTASTEATQINIPTTAALLPVLEITGPTGFTENWQVQSNQPVTKTIYYGISVTDQYNITPTITSDKSWATITSINSTGSTGTNGQTAGYFDIVVSNAAIGTATITITHPNFSSSSDTMTVETILGDCNEYTIDWTGSWLQAFSPKNISYMNCGGTMTTDIYTGGDFPITVCAIGTPTFSGAGNFSLSMNTQNGSPIICTP
tara:strand:- start:4995 stop:7109 length:2115 start_codon:yes stop_codon:yes gene_type:complete